MTKALSLVLLLLLASCGLRPLHSGGSSGQVATGLAAVKVSPIPERAGWLVRNALVDRLGGEAGQPKYRLEVELDDDISGFGIRGDSAVTRERRTLRARYRLFDAASGQVLIDSSASADAGIDVVSSEYATIAAEQAAQERLAMQIADQIVAKLGLFMTGPAARP